MLRCDKPVYEAAADKVLHCTPELPLESHKVCYMISVHAVSQEERIMS